MSAALYQLASALAHPFSLVVTLLVAACATMLTSSGRRRLSGRYFSVLGLALYVLSSPVVSTLATRSLEGLYPPASLDEIRRTQAIVVLAGGFRRGPDNQGQLALDTISRCLFAASIYRSAGARPVVVSGGLLSTGPSNVPVSRAMKGFLIELGVAEGDILEESRSTTTFENAVESRALLSARGASHIVLVTSATHLPRAVAAFTNQRLSVVPAGSGATNPDLQFDLLDLIPSATSADTINRAAHEWIGLAWYRLRGRL